MKLLANSSDSAEEASYEPRFSEFAPSLRFYSSVIVSLIQVHVRWESPILQINKLN